eukprot:TRINITY_DN1354_c0_g1_i4.p1 TRINITY_DN1354_c0_g1~~TRINITY_DN1354_c0_g1_i4.p1  ORF type:complete len:311 (+),score=20.34 TRINITY_DN1354_c0_g1_i4:655-1587(+)
MKRSELVEKNYPTTFSFAGLPPTLNPGPLSVFDINNMPPIEELAEKFAKQVEEHIARKKLEDAQKADIAGEFAASAIVHGFFNPEFLEEISPQPSEDPAANEPAEESSEETEFDGPDTSISEDNQKILDKGCVRGKDLYLYIIFADAVKNSPKSPAARYLAESIDKWHDRLENSVTVYSGDEFNSDMPMLRAIADRVADAVLRGDEECERTARDLGIQETFRLIVPDVLAAAEDFCRMEKNALMSRVHDIVDAYLKYVDIPRVKKPKGFQTLSQLLRFNPYPENLLSRVDQDDFDNLVTEIRFHEIKAHT